MPKVVVMKASKAAIARTCLRMLFALAVPTAANKDRVGKLVSDAMATVGRFACCKISMTFFACWSLSASSRSARARLPGAGCTLVKAAGDKSLKVVALVVTGCEGPAAPLLRLDAVADGL